MVWTCYGGDVCGKLEMFAVKYKARRNFRKMDRERNRVIVVRGGGDLASGVIHRLHRCGYRVLILESENPSAVRRMVSFCEAVYDGETLVEGVLCRKADSLTECEAIWEKGDIPLLCDPAGESIWMLRPAAVIDAVMAKRNLGTQRGMAPLTIALGPGFEAGEDVDYVVETMRGHNLGRIIQEGAAFPNTGIPGVIAGVGAKRVIRATADGNIHNCADISDLVEEGDVLAMIGETLVLAPFTGILRGMIRDGYYVNEGMKIGDMDPRVEETENCFTISDKARCIAGSVLEILVAEGVLPE